MFSMRLEILLNEGKAALAGGAFNIGDEGPISSVFLIASL